jgi:hypothetical protein
MQLNMRIRNVTTTIALVRKVGIPARDAQGHSNRCCVTRIWRFIRRINVLQGARTRGSFGLLDWILLFLGRARLNFARAVSPMLQCNKC